MNVNCKNSLRNCLNIVLVIILFSCNDENNLLGPPQDLKINYQKEASLINEDPRFSWELNDKTPGAQQYAYQILVSTDPEKLDTENADVWNSGKVLSAESIGIIFKGEKLTTNQHYFWTVKTWDNEENESGFADHASFKTGLLDQKNWQPAQWIGRDTIQFPPRSIALRKDFLMDKTVKVARVFVTGLGNYVLFLNGEKVGNDKLTPGWTHYPKKVQYQTYDVTKQLIEGENAVGAYLGNMWWSSGLGWKGGKTYANGPLSLLFKMIIQYEDGSTGEVVSDQSWYWHQSPIVENTLYNGETYDARLEMYGWSAPGYEMNRWQQTDLIIHNDSFQLVAQQAPTIQVTEEINPVKITEVKPGVHVFDLGQNMVGVARLKVNEPAGTSIIMRFAELLHQDGTVAQENLRSAEVDDIYICNGNGEEIYEPYFTYHGFRYVQVEGLTSPPDESTITGIVFHTNAPRTGEFASANQLLNQINTNIQWGTRGNFMSVPTDCPQRDERLGWMGDAQIFAATANYNYNLASFWQKWQMDILDGQEPAGWVYDVNPPIVVEGPAKPGWGDAVVIVPWENYRFYADERILQNSYTGMKAWVDYMQDQSQNYIYEWGDTDWGGYGDWVAVEESPGKPIGCAYYYYSSKLLSQIAEVLKKNDEYEYYKNLSKNIASAYHSKYFNTELGQYEGATQTANLLPVAFGITPPELRDAVVGKIVENIKARDNHLTTGFLGTKYLLPILSEYGHHELAYKIATQTTYPSWGYMVEKGATTMWELWNSDTERPEGMNSRNHFAYGTIGEWFFGYLAGIRPVFEEPGFKKSIIAPLPAKDLPWAQASLHTPYGELASRWEQRDNVLKMDVTIPANCLAEVRLPKLGKSKVVVKETNSVLYDGKQKNKKPGIKFLKENNNEVIFEVGGGSYLFSIQ